MKKVRKRRIIERKGERSDEEKDERDKGMKDNKKEEDNDAHII